MKVLKIPKWDFGAFTVHPHCNAGGVECQFYKADRYTWDLIQWAETSELLQYTTFSRFPGNLCPKVLQGGWWYVGKLKWAMVGVFVHVC